METVSGKEGVLGRGAGVEAVMGDGPSARADAGFSRWPTGVGDVAFEGYLDDLDAMFSARPSAADASVDLDEVQIAVDVDFIKKFLNVKEGLEELVKTRHEETVHSRLNVESITGLEGFPKYKELRELAVHGAQAHLRQDFQFNRGVGDFVRPQARMLRAAIRHQYGKLQRKGWCIIVPKELVEGIDGVHVSPTHVACKRGDTKGRCGVDENASGLNEATNMEAIEIRLGQMTLPGLQELSTMLHRAWCLGARELFKTDVSSAFNRIKLSFDAVLSQATQVDSLIVFPLVAVFGWTASPIYYSLAADAVHWAHNGGVSGAILDSWRRQQGKSVRPRDPGEIDSQRSVTYVDDTFGPIMPGDNGISSDDADTIICKLHAADGVNPDKVERGPQLTCLGWYIDMVLGTIRPSDRGIQKMLWWCFRKVTHTSSAVLLHELQSLVSLLRWYSVVIGTRRFAGLVSFTRKSSTRSAAFAMGPSGWCLPKRFGVLALALGRWVTTATVMVDPLVVSGRRVGRKGGGLCIHRCVHVDRGRFCGRFALVWPVPVGGGREEILCLEDGGNHRYQHYGVCGGGAGYRGGARIPKWEGGDTTSGQYGCGGLAEQAAVESHVGPILDAAPHHDCTAI